MSPRKTAKLAFASAQILLLLTGVAALIVISRYSNSADWVAHTYDVEIATGAVQTALNNAARDRWIFVTLGDQSVLRQYETSKNDTNRDLFRLRDFLHDPQQMELYDRLESLVARRLGLLQTSMNAYVANQSDAKLEDSITLENTKLSADTAAIISQMTAREDELLQARKLAQSNLFAGVFLVLGSMLVIAMFLLWAHYRLLGEELGKREQAESGARRLSAHVLALQDEERRKFSRELHDSLGQNLAVAKMIAFGLSEKNPRETSLPELIDLLDRAIQEMRTISHLMHPPLLDELGIASAVVWYVEGFSQRSGLKINAKVSDEIGRLPRPAELVLFRVLQESLTNVHRHAKSSRAEVTLGLEDDAAVLQVRDYGIGIPAAQLQQFRSNGTQAGVGLTGMRERVREQGGQFEIYSDNTGTEVVVTIPLHLTPHPQEELAASTATD